MVSGSCNCGAVKYQVQVKGDSLPILFCHCLDCREAHGSPYTAVFAAPAKNITWTGLEENTVKYNRKGTNERHFCKTCGTHMTSHLIGPNVFAVFTPSIKECPLPKKPAMHIHVSEKDPLIQMPEDGLPRKDKGP